MSSASLPSPHLLDCYCASLVEMNALCVTVVLGLLAGVWAQVVLRPECDSPEAEAAALAAQDYLNAHHTHFYKYALNRIEDIKVYSKPDGNNTYKLEIDLLETDCHVLDPTPLANCTVRPERLTSVQGDCDVVLEKVAGVMTVKAFKCKTEESTEDMCLGCPLLLPLNDTTALDFVHASLATFNNMTANTSYTIMEIGRMSSQIVSGGPIYAAEYVVVEANCTEDVCVALNDPMAARGFCTAKGSSGSHSVDCKMFIVEMPVVDVNSTAAPVVPPVVHVHTDSLTRKHGLRHHKLTTFHNPELSGHLSAESAESAEVVPVVPAVAAVTAASVDSTSSSVSVEVPLAVVKRDVPDSAPTVPIAPALPMPVCPGRIRFF